MWKCGIVCYRCKNFFSPQMSAELSDQNGGSVFYLRPHIPSPLRRSNDFVVLLIIDCCSFNKDIQISAVCGFLLRNTLPLSQAFYRPKLSDLTSIFDFVLWTLDLKIHCTFSKDWACCFQDSLLSPFHCFFFLEILNLHFWVLGFKIHWLVQILGYPKEKHETLRRWVRQTR